MKEVKERYLKANRLSMSRWQRSVTKRSVPMADVKPESGKKEDQSSVASDGKCARCRCAKAIVATDHAGRDLGEPTYCLRCSEMLVARALKDWRLCN